MSTLSPLPRPIVAALLTLALASCTTTDSASPTASTDRHAIPADRRATNNPAPVTSGVKIWEQDVKIPTYLIGPPDPNPQFYLGGQSQGAQARIYPYPAYDILTTDKVDKTYKMVYLENEYVKIGVLPDNGGRIFESLDKTNGYGFFYNQHVIKPALISLLGAWISGGVEWDLPHHHRATSFVPVQYTLEEAPDGSKTVWVGELELRDRMRWAVGLTLHPGKSFLEASFRIINRTPVPTSMLCFSNVGVFAGTEYQIIFPPSTQFFTNHKKPYFQPWTEQLSWLKNHPTSGSWFAWNYTDDFMAGYDHALNAGTMSIADHTVVPGKKFFTWGTQNTAEFNRLTDSDGPYLELMVGAYSDNQPDYSWMAPYETRTWTQYWYPFRDIGGVKCANTDAAVNLDIADSKIKLGFYSTSARQATALLKWKDKTILSEKVALSPAKTFLKELPLPAGADPHDLRASLVDDTGAELVAYAPIQLPTPVQPGTPVPVNYGDPASIKTNEELLLIGQRIEQFHTPYDPATPGTTINNATPEPFWNEALKRDPGDVRVNTAMGIQAIKAARYADAEKFLRKALERATDRFTTPKDGEPFYYLGLALKGQGKTDDAFNQFAKATWSNAWRSPGYFHMAQIATLRGDQNTALTYTNDSLNANAQNVQALALKSALLRHAGRNADALAAANAITAIDPLDVHALAEKWHLTPNPATARALADQVAILPTTALEVAADYQNAGLWKDGTDLLTQLLSDTPDKSKASPLIYYYLGYFAQQMNQPTRATAFYQRAAKASPDYVFPFQMELIPVLEAAIAANPTDARAPYYLGNLLFDWQPDRAVALWEKSAALNADFPVVYRNLAMVYANQPNQRDKVIAALEKAAQVGGNASIFEQLDRLYEENGLPPEKRLALLEKNQPALNRPEVIAREINLAVYAGKPDLAARLIQSVYFRAWEGRNGYAMGDAWVNANITAGNQHLANKQFPQAIAAFQAAQQLPPNLEEEGGGNITPRRAEIAYYLGNTYEAMNDLPKARDAWTAASGTGPATTAPAGRGRGRGRGAAPAPGTRVAAADPYFQAMALVKLGQTDKAKPIFQQLVDTGTATLRTNAEPNPLPAAVPPATRSLYADAHYLLALGYLGQGDLPKAKQELTAALHISPDHFSAKTTLSQLAQ